MKAKSKLVGKLVEYLLGRLVSYATKRDKAINNILDLEDRLTIGVQSLSLTHQLRLVSHFITDNFINSILKTYDSKEDEENLYHNIILFNENSSIDSFLIAKFFEEFLLGIRNDNSLLSTEVHQKEKIFHSNNNEESYVNNYQDGYDDYFERSRFGNKNREKLGLTNQEVERLNLTYIGDTVFTEIEQCADESAKLFLHLVDKLDQLFQEKGRKIFEILNRLDKKEVSFDYDYYGYTNNSRWMKPVTFRLFNNILKIAENAIRSQYRHTRKREEVYAYSDMEDFFGVKLKEYFESVIEKYNLKILPASKETELRLNKLNRTRWKADFQLIKSNVQSAKPKEIAKRLNELLTLNKDNPSLYNLYFESVKVFVHFSKLEALKCYLYYYGILMQEPKSQRRKIKPLPKSIEKKVFSEKESKYRFNKIIDQLSRDRRLDLALENVVNVFKKERKKITLDKAVINKINETHKETVETLNVILADESVLQEEGLMPEIKITVQEEEKGLEDIFGEPEKDEQGSMIEFNKVQIKLLDLFLKRNMELTQVEVSEFAKANQKLKGQLVNKINDLFYEHFEEVLIEDSEERYEINEEFKTLIKGKKYK